MRSRGWSNDTFSEVACLHDLRANRRNLVVGGWSAYTIRVLPHHIYAGLPVVSVEPVKPRKLVTAADLRGVLLATIEGVLEGRVNVAQANAVIGASGELHKSIRQEWDMRVYANENLSLDAGRVIDLLEGKQDVDQDT